MPVALGVFGRGDGWWFAGVLGADRGGGLGALLQLDFSSGGGVCLSFGPRVCSRGPGGLLIVVASWAVWGCGCLGVPIWVSPFWSGPCHIHKPGLKKYSFILWLILIGGGGSLLD